MISAGWEVQALCLVTLSMKVCSQVSHLQSRNWNQLALKGAIFCGVLGPGCQNTKNTENKQASWISFFFILPASINPCFYCCAVFQGRHQPYLTSQFPGVHCLWPNFLHCLAPQKLLQWKPSCIFPNRMQDLHWNEYKILNYRVSVYINSTHNLNSRAVQYK